jgi:hypothetical protein
MLPNDSETGLATVKLDETTGPGVPAAEEDAGGAQK